MVNDNKTYKVVIVGGGLSGLAVAYAVERAKKEGRVRNVQVVVFERRTEEFGYSRYPIRVSPEGREALQSLLTPEDYNTLLHKTAHGITEGGYTIFTEKLKPLFKLVKHIGQTPQFAHRWVIGQLLTRGVDIRRGKRVVRIRELGEGREKIDVVFDDGTDEKADLVIAADGVGSTIRAQLHPTHAKVPALPYIGIQLKLLTPITRLPRLAPSTINVISGTQPYSLILTPFHGIPVPPLGSTEMNPFTDPSDYEPTVKVLDEPCPEYIFTAFCMKAFQGWEDMTSQAWIGKIAKILRNDGADEDLAKAIEEGAVPQTVGAWQLVSMNPDDLVKWKEGRVILIGDSAHTMLPQGGVGASIALKDADHLVKVLLSSTELGGQDGPLDTLLPIFHDEMMARASGLMRDAKRRLYWSHPEGVKVYLTRALLWTMNLFWPLANWVLYRGRGGIDRNATQSKKLA